MASVFQPHKARRALTGSTLLLALLPAGQTAWSQTFPDKPVRLDRQHFAKTRVAGGFRTCGAGRIRALRADTGHRHEHQRGLPRFRDDRPGA